MKINELRELKTIIYDIYYNGEDPIKFFEKTGLENYMEELYPSNPNKLFGDWITKNFDTSAFILKDKVNKKINELGELFNKVRFYANIPNGQTVKQFISEYQRITQENNTISN